MPPRKLKKPTKAAPKKIAKAKPAAKRTKPKPDLVALTAESLAARVDHWLCEGAIGGTPVSYTVENGVMTYRRDGEPRPIALKDERVIARKFCPTHYAYLAKIEACRAAIEGGATLDKSTLQALADLAHPMIAQAVKARGVKLPKARPPVGDPVKLHAAAHDGDLTLVRAQLALGCNVDVLNHQGYTVLLVAARAGYAEMVDVLIAAGANVNATLPEGFSPLHLTIERTKNRPMNFTVTLTRDGKKVTLTDRDEIRAATGAHPDDEYEAHVAIARALIAAGADVDRAMKPSKQTPLSFGANTGATEIMELLVATKRVTLDSQDVDGVSPLHYASRAGFVDCVNVLLRAGASPNIAENYGFTPLHEAAENGHAKVAPALLDAGADRARALTKPYEKYPAGATPLDVAKLAGRKAMIALLSK